MSAARQEPLLSPGAVSMAAFVAETPLNMVMLDRGGRILQASPAMISTTGRPREYLVGALIEDLFSANAAPLLEILASGDLETPVDVPMQPVQMPNGDVHWTQTSLSPWREADGTIGGLICVNNNMTAQQRALGELGRTKALLDAVVESIPSMLAVQDYETGAYVRVNRAAEAFLGLRREQIIGQQPPDSLGKDFLAKHQRAIEAANVSAESSDEDEQVPDKSGEMRTLHARRLVITDQDGTKHALTVAEDVTDQRRAAEALQRALDDAESANRAKSAFLATMSHEIRTPLNGVLGMAQAMARDALPEEQRDRLAVIRQSGEALLAILNDILDLSKVEAGKLELEAMDFDLPQSIENAAAGFAAIAAGKGLALVVDTTAAEGACRGDPARVRQVVSNLITNAVKFTEAGEVRVTARRQGGDVNITVSDTGPGIAPESLDRLFDKFVQADSSTTRRFGGTGLGLAICRELAHAMGGTVSARSILGQGAHFTLTLPLPQAAGARPAAVDLEPELAVDLRILAAEDNPINQQVLKTIFEQIGLPITIVGDGAAAVEACRTRAWDIILMDVQMPILCGPEATRAIRQLERENGRPRTPIIALTANAMEHQKAEYLACGMDGLVAKPLQIAELFGVINRYIGAADDADLAQARA